LAPGPRWASASRSPPAPARRRSRRRAGAAPGARPPPPPRRAARRCHGIAPASSWLPVLPCNLDCRGTPASPPRTSFRPLRAGEPDLRAADRAVGRFPGGQVGADVAGAAGVRRRPHRGRRGLACRELAGDAAVARSDLGAVLAVLALRD